MSDPENNPSPNDLDAYLDGLLSPIEREEFARRLATDASLRKELELQRQIDRELRRKFQLPPVPALDLTQPSAQPTVERPAYNGTPHRLADTPPVDGHIARPQQSQSVGGRRWSLSTRGEGSRRRVVALSVVAVVAWTLVIWNLRPQSRDPVVFKARPLAAVYHETVSHGFEPYYICEEEERFRSTFYHRSGQALKLAELPAGREMVGLSYLPSVSRLTTAMLARVDGREVMVFVDKLDRDRPVEPPSAESGLRMFRRELNGLVMYEVTPFDEPQMMDFLLPADPPPDACATE